MKWVSIRLTDLEHLAVEQLVALKFYKNRTAAIQKALDLLFDEHKLQARHKDEIGFQRRPTRKRPRK